MRTLMYSGILSFLISMFSCYVPVSGESNYMSVPPDVDLFASSDGLAYFKENVAEDPIGYGYNSLDEVKRTTLGSGFQVRIIDPAKLASSKAERLLDISVPLEQWEYVIELDRRPKSYLSIARDEDGLFAAAFGGNAEEVGTSLSKVNQFIKFNSDSTNDIYLIRDKNIRYLVTVMGQSEYFIPSISRERSFYLNGMSNEEMWQSSKLIEYLQEVQKSHIGDIRDSGMLPAPETTNREHRFYMKALISLAVSSSACALIYFIQKRIKR